MVQAERLRILKMVEEGKIGVEEANELLKALDDGARDKNEVKKGKARFIKILVREDDQEKVNISIPLALAKTALKFMPRSARESLDDQEIDIENLLASIESGVEDGTLVNIDDDDTHVEIKIV